MLSIRATFFLNVFLLSINLFNAVPLNNNPETDSELFEGDIAGIDKNIFENQKGVAQIPNLLRELWPYGIVPYTIDPAYNSTERAQILSGMKYLEDSTRVNGKDCIKFVPQTTEVNYVRVYPGGGCSSLVGKNKLPNPQDLSLARPGCLVNAIVAHEFMHALGFFHEQSRPDRDDHVTIYSENIQDGMANNFAKYNTNQVDYLGLPYDYDSVMHYNTKDFSKNGEPTILPNVPGTVIGQRKYLSPIDILEIQRFYNCVKY